MEKKLIQENTRFMYVDTLLVKSIFKGNVTHLNWKEKLYGFTFSNHV
jgi:hypothetical protein